MRRPHPGPDLVHPEPFGAGIRGPPGGFPPFDMLPPPEILEQKLSAQDEEMGRLLTENQRLAATHGNLRLHLAAAQQELQMLQGQVGGMKSEREQQIKGVMDNIAKMEAELEAAESVKLELQQAHVEAQSLVAARQELVGQVQQVTQDLQKTHADLRQMPSLLSELDHLRQEYQHCRASYEYEKKLYGDHLDSLQEMEKNYMDMAREVDKLRAELNNTANADTRSATAYGSGVGYSSTDGVLQGRGPLPTIAAAAGGASGPMASGGAHVGSQLGVVSARAGYDAPRGPSYEAQRGSSYGPAYDVQGRPYDPHRGAAGYDPQRGLPTYDMQRLPPAYDAQRTSGYGYDAQRTAGYGYDAQRTTGGYGYDAQMRGAGSAVHPSANTAPHGSTTPPTRVGSGYEAPPPLPPQGGNQGRR